MSRYNLDGGMVCPSCGVVYNGGVIDLGQCEACERHAPLETLAPHRPEIDADTLVKTRAWFD